jgi:hypothetical protein
MYRLIRMVIEMARKAGACFSFVDFMSCITMTARSPIGHGFHPP